MTTDYGRWVCLGREKKESSRYKHTMAHFYTVEGEKIMEVDYAVNISSEYEWIAIKFLIYSTWLGR